MKRIIYIVVLLFAASAGIMASNKGQNHPYADDKALQMGGFIGPYFPAFIAVPAAVEQRDVRSYNIGYGLTLGGYFDFRLAPHLNLRTNPGLCFGIRKLKYNNPIKETDDILSIPISIPLYLKWSAEREANYRPYLTAGMGVSCDMFTLFNRSEKLQIKTKPWDFFLQFGMGCDFYSHMPKAISIELRYQLGFVNVLTPAGSKGWNPDDTQFSDALNSLKNQAIVAIFFF